MKRLLAIGLAVTMMVGLISCGKSENGKNDGDSSRTPVSPSVEPILTEEPDPTGEKPITDEKPPVTDEKKYEVKPVNSKDLSGGSSAETPVKKEADEEFIHAMNDFTFRMFREGYIGENGMVSPLSAMLAFSMVGNGAANRTLEQMIQALHPEIGMDEMNSYLVDYVEKLTANEDLKMNIANSIWVKDYDAFQVRPEFLRVNATYYKSSVFKAAFDEGTLQDINNWCSNKTDGMIPEVLKQINEDSIMYLINAIVFDAKWASEYDDEQVKAKSFRTKGGQMISRSTLFSYEDVYLEDENTTGVMKYYKGGKYAFVGLLPEKGMDIDTYISELTGEKWANLWNTRSGDYIVDTTIPEFKYDTKTDLIEMMQKFGMTDAFSGELADFSNLGALTNGNNIAIGEAFQMTHIDVSKNGTKAAAVTVIGANECTAIEEPKEYKQVHLDRPFVYAIVDTETGIPTFIGTVTE